MKKIFGMCLLLVASTAFADQQEKVQIRCEKVVKDDVYTGMMSINGTKNGSMYMTVHSYQPNPAQDEGLAGRQSFEGADTGGSERDIYFNHWFALSSPLGSMKRNEVSFTSVFATQNIDGTFRVAVRGPAVKAIMGRNKMVFNHCWKESE